MASSAVHEGEVQIQCPEVSSTLPVTLGNPNDNPVTVSPPPEPPIQNPLPRNVYRQNRSVYPRPYPVITRPVQERTENSVKDKQEISNTDTGSTQNALLVVGSIFIFSACALLYLYTTFPELEESEKPHIKLPRDIEDAKELGRILDKYKERYFSQVLTGVFVTYIFLQTFAIPGSISLSILSGFLFPFPAALLLVCFCSATGASLCYVLSYFLGRRLIYKYIPDKAKKWSAVVSKHRDNLLNYLLFLRITPFLPNWFINIASPVIGVPLTPFWIGTFLGVAPPSFVAIQAGQTLYKLTASSDAWSWTSVILLAVFAVLSLVPVLLKQKLKKKFE